MIPISATEDAVTDLARNFAGRSKSNLEVFGYWIGLEADRLTHLVLPEFLMGIRRDPGGAMANATDTRCTSTVMYALQADCGDLGILVHTCPESGAGRLPEGNCLFIPMELLVLNRPMAAYLSTEARSEHFAGVPPEKISAAHIAHAIETCEDRKQTLLYDRQKRWREYFFLPSLAIKLDAFVHNSRVYPMNAFILKALALNRFTRIRKGKSKKGYGRVHIHYAYRFLEIMGDRLINAIHKKDKRFIELMTPVDAISMLDSTRAVQEISERKLTMAQQIEAIVALDPKSLRVIGRSFFDLQVLESDAERSTFKEIATKAVGSRKIKAHIRWFDYIRGLSTREPPGF